MTAAQMTNRAVEMIKTYTYSNDPQIERGVFGYTVSFTMCTTSVRSSSAVTRLRLIMSEMSAGSKEIKVVKELNQEFYPEDRAQLASWVIKIFVPVAVRKGREKAN